MEKSPLSKIFTDSKYRNIVVHINKYLFDRITNELLLETRNTKNFLDNYHNWYDLHPNYILGGDFPIN
jgi:hypothetical protein